jgi:2-polyprenyl-3-methyl-5-hydroxy-6-metoxy-1,4-benzoquinol methylase
MTTAVDHYNEHLGPLYLWMVGDLDAAFRRSEAELDALHLPSRIGGIAVDLGAGFGLHALPLARRGFSVVAIDTYEPLLKELAARRGSLPIHTINTDLLGFRAHIEMPVDVIVCMGDTLTHLPSHSGVASLLEDAASSLNPGGVFVATFRDYVSTPLQGDARFILVRGDEERILTCFLEYTQTTVIVHDVLHRREGAAWRLRVSGYPKLRLAPEWVAARLSSLGLAVHRDTTSGGMIRIAARRRGPPGAVESDPAA